MVRKRFTRSGACCFNSLSLRFDACYVMSGEPDSRVNLASMTRGEEILNRDLVGCASYSYESKWCLPVLYRYHVSHFLLTGVPATNAKNGGARRYEHSAPPGGYQEGKSKGEF